MTTIKDIVDFCRSDKAGPCFKGWPENILTEWVMFHVEHGSLIYVTDDQERITGMCVAVRCDENEIEKHWVPSRNDGEIVYISDFIASNPHVFSAVANAICKKNPDWQGLRYFMRKSKPVGTKVYKLTSDKMLRMLRSLEYRKEELCFN